MNRNNFTYVKDDVVKMSSAGSTKVLLHDVMSPITRLANFLSQTASPKTVLRDTTIY